MAALRRLLGLPRMPQLQLRFRATTSATGRPGLGAVLAAAATAGAVIGGAATAVAAEPNPFDGVSAQFSAPGHGSGGGRRSIRQNRVLAPRHRVILGEWPIISAFGANDPRAITLEALFEHCKAAGYDGIEIGPSMTEFIPWFPQGTPHDERVRKVREIATRTGVPVLGCTYCVGGRAAIEDTSKGYINLEFEEPNFLEILRARIRSDMEYGCEYASFQLHLPPEHCETGGMYRNDTAFLELSARRVADIQRVCFEEGVNFYVETHIFKISEDIQAFNEIMRRAPFFEVNGDLSHYIYRGIWKGPAIENILSRVTNTTT